MPALSNWLEANRLFSKLVQVYLEPGVAIRSGGCCVRRVFGIEIVGCFPIVGNAVRIGVDDGCGDGWVRRVGAYFLLGCYNATGAVSNVGHDAGIGGVAFWQCGAGVGEDALESAGGGFGVY